LLCRYLADNYGLTNNKVLGINLRILDGETKNVVVNHVADLVKDFTSKGFVRIVFISFGFGGFEYKFLDNDSIIAQKRSFKSRVEDLMIFNEELNPRQVLRLFNY